MSNQKGFAPILIIVVLLVIGTLAFGGYWFLNQQKNSSSQSTNQKSIGQINNNETTPETNPNINQQPILSPSIFTFVRDGDIWSGQGEGKDLKVLTSYKHNSNPVLSHDSKKIAYLSTPLETVKQIEGIEKSGGIMDGMGPGFNVWIINFDGSNPKKLTSSPIAYPDIQFSPNDKYVSFISPLDNRIIVLNAEDGKEVLNVKMQGSASIHKNHIWDRDSQNILIAESINAAQAQYSGVSIYKVNISSQQVTQIASIPSGDNNFSKIDYSISPDLKKLAYFTEVQRVISYGVAEYDWVYYVTDLNGTNTQAILSKKGAKTYHGPNIFFSWSPDSNNLGFYNEEGSGIPTKLNVYDIQNKKLFNALDSEVSKLVWDKNNNLYMKRFITNVGLESGFSKIDFRTGKYEKFLENIEILNFGD